MPEETAPSVRVLAGESSPARARPPHDERLITRNAQGEIEGVKYDRLSAMLAGAIQELVARERAQSEAIAELRQELRALQQHMAPPATR